MPLGIVSDEDFLREVEISNKTKESKLIDMPEKGRGNGNVEVPEALRKIIGETALTEGRQEAISLAQNFGISDSSVSAYSRGATSTSSYNQPVPSLHHHLLRTKRRIAKRASQSLNKALDNITDDKLKESKAGELAAVAKAMSGIIKDMEPEQAKENIQKNQFIVMVPPQTKESRFPVITLNEE